MNIFTKHQNVPVGDLRVTAAVQDALARGEITDGDLLTAVTRTGRGDFGLVDDEQREVNDIGLESKGRIRAVYHSEAGTEFWLQLDLCRQVTHIALPSDYE